MYWDQGVNKKKLDLVKQKGFYPYEYITDFEKFKEKLSSKEKSYSLLTGQKTNGKEYDRVFNIWNKFGMKTMKEYNDLYLKCGVLLLADVFENLEKIA